MKVGLEHDHISTLLSSIELIHHNEGGKVAIFCIESQFSSLFLEDKEMFKMKLVTTISHTIFS